MTKDTRTLMVFGDGKKHNGTDAWFWGDLTGRGPADEPNIFPLVLQMGVWSGELTLEQARYLRDLRGDEWWSNIDFRVIRQHLAEQEGKPAPVEPAPRAKRAKQIRPTLPARQADELIASLRQATAALLEAEKRYNPDQPRHPAGDPRGGQWRPEGGGGGQQVTGSRVKKSTSRKIKDVGGGVNVSILLEDENGTRWIWKAVDQETKHDGHSEVAAHEVAKLLGMDCVPVTRYEEWDGELGTSQQFIDGQLGWEWQAEHGSTTPIAFFDQEDVEDVVVLDAIIGNFDRHEGNWIVDSDQKVQAIDHGHSWWEEGDFNNFDWLMSNRLLNYRYDYNEEAGELMVTQSKIERWSQITEEQFLNAFGDFPGDDEPRVNPEAAWTNFHAIVESGGVVRWGGGKDPRRRGSSADPPMDEEFGDSETLRRAQIAEGRLFGPSTQRRWRQLRGGKS